MNKYKIANITTSLNEIVLCDIEPTECLNNAHTLGSVLLIEADVQVNDGTPIHQQATLDAYKELRYKEFDIKTSEMIGLGFTFDSKPFSLSIPAQSNWTNIKSNKATFTAMALFPVQISTSDNDVYMLAEADVDGFWGAGLNVVKTAYNGGADLKKLVKDATDRAGVDAVVDNR